ncbi:hypothetical protein [Candidatus Poriferisocius sp.]|uniref:hypothetical protein n=1 Tax=Candidatus Poriferisocius sp. TaxID=3101276 RepID=UPI003B025093
MDQHTAPAPEFDCRRIVTATGEVVSKPDLRPGDAVLVWSYPDHRGSRTTGKHIGPSPIGTAHPSPEPDRMEAAITEAVVVRVFTGWLAAAASRGVRLGCPVAHPVSQTPQIDGTIDVAMTRQDLINALALTHIDIEAGHPIGLDHDTCPMTDEQEEHHSGQTLKMSYRLATTPAPADTQALGITAELALPNALVGWRQAGQPVHISALRRIARQTAIFPGPANTAELKLRAGDLVAVTSGHHPHTGAAGHAVARNPTSRTPARIVEVSASWHRHIQQRDIFPGIQIADRGHTAMMAMTGPDIDAAIDLAALDASICDADNPPTLDPDTNPLYSRRQRAAIASYNELKRQEAAISNPETAAACLDYTTTADTLTETAAHRGTPIDLGL